MSEAVKNEEKVVVKKFRKPSKKKVCAFCVAGEKTIDYKDIAKIRKYVTEKGKIEAKLIKNEKTKIVNVDEVNGVSAVSLYSPLRVYEDCSLLKVKILTGRTHQIRVHLKHINHPLVGDQKYGNRNSDLLAKKYGMHGYFLHAKKLCFHNLTGSLSYLNGKEFIAPLFDWENKLINKLNGGY